MKTLYYSLLLTGLALNGYGQHAAELDSSFNSIGWDQQAIHDNGVYAHNLLVQADQKPLLCMQGNFSSEAHQAMLVRYNTDGSLDESFNGTGIVKTADDFTEVLYTRATGSCLSPDGKILVAADFWYSGERVICLMPDGTLDETFGTGGYADFDRSEFGFFYDINMLLDGTIIVSGTEYYDGTDNYDFFLLALDAEGNRKTAFGDGGVLGVNLPGADEVHDLIIAGMETTSGNSVVVHTYHHGLLVSYEFDGDGNPVFAYGTDGVAANALPGDLYSLPSPGFFKMDEDENFWAVFNAYDPETDESTTRVLKVDNEGNLDDMVNEDMFNLDRTLTLESGIMPWNGKLYLTGAFKVAPETQYIFRFNMDGTPDADFGTLGAMALSPGLPQIYNMNIATDTSGAVYLAGVTTASEDSVDYIIVKLKGEPAGELPSSLNNPAVNKLQVNVYPNPATDHINIKTSEAAAARLYDITGKTLITSPASRSHQLNVQSLPAGNYILEIQNQHFKVVKKDR